VASAGARSRSSACRPDSLPFDCTIERPDGRLSSAWAGSRSPISHESEFAVATAYGVRTVGGRFLFPPDIDERIDERERHLLGRLERLRAMGREAAMLEEDRDAR